MHVYAIILIIILITIALYVCLIPSYNQMNIKLFGGENNPFKYVHINPNSKYTLIYIHGYNPIGAKYAKELFIDTIEKTRYKNICSYGIFYRKIEHDLEGELKRFQDYVFTTFPSGPYILLGHSYGACYAKYFMENTRGIDKAISLDGSNLYITVPYDLNVEGAEKDKIIYTEDDAIYNGKGYIGLDEYATKEYYKVMYKTTKNDNSKYYLVYYNAGETPTSPPKIELIPNKWYKNFYEMYYGKEYSHSLHKYPKCLELILDTVLQ